MNNSYNERSMKIIDLKKTILEDNDVDADRLREELKKKNVFTKSTFSDPVKVFYFLYFFQKRIFPVLPVNHL